MTMNIQSAILSSFLWSNDIGIDTSDAFLLDTRVFNGAFMRIAGKTNSVTETDDRFYSLLNLELENKMPHEWSIIAAQTPMPFSLAKKYHDHLISEKNKKIITGEIQ